MVKKPGVNWQIVLIKWVVPVDELSSTLIADNMVTCGLDRIRNVSTVVR
jgi:hypothetical protein